MLLIQYNRSNLENFNNCSYTFLSSLDSSISIVLTFLPGSLNGVNWDSSSLVRLNIKAFTSSDCLCLPESLLLPTHCFHIFEMKKYRINLLIL